MAGGGFGLPRPQPGATLAAERRKVGMMSIERSAVTAPASALLMCSAYAMCCRTCVCCCL